MNKGLVCAFACLLSLGAGAQQKIYEYERDDARVLFFNEQISEKIPHIIRKYEEGKSIHNQVWGLPESGKGQIQPPMLLVTEWGDDGNGGASALPKNMISIEMAPLNFSYFISPSSERYHHLFRHEYTHTVMTDRTAAPDRFWRSALGGKFVVDSQHPFSALWSYLSAPRWYAPRWYHEGIACFMETWLSGGVGRALGGYDEMYFRSIVDSGNKLYSVVGLETEGTTSDFQVGTNSYLYGTRFVNYLEYQYGLDKLLAFYNRTEDSKTLFNRQFKSVYGKSLRKVWDDWRDFEVVHQKEQLESISEHPVTQTTALTDKSLGSMSPMVLDTAANCVYMAVNYPGDFAHIERLDLGTGKRSKIAKVDSPQLYQTCYLALDSKGQRLFWTTQNSSFRGLRVFDLKKGRITKKLNFQRSSCLVYDNARDYLYALLTSGGKMYLCRYDKDINDRELLYSFPFGTSVFDIDVSPDGSLVSCTLSGDNGEQSLIMFKVEDLEQARYRYDTLYTSEDSNLGQFRFTPDGRSLVGSSYYTGVSNIWSLDLESRELSLLSNTRIGLFAPLMLPDGKLLCCEFDRNGMRPVSFKPEKIEDANAVEMLGQLSFEAHSEELLKLASLEDKSAPISFGEVYDSIKVYSPLKKLAFVGAYPEISGFRDKTAWNRVTPVLGYRFMFQDPLGLNSLKFSLGMSPWSGNDRINQYHAQMEWKYWQWKLDAAWNPTSFYDLVGPIQSSRKGWQIGLSYDSSYSLLLPEVHNYGARIAAYGMMDALPLYQEIETTDIRSFQTASAYYQYRKTRSTLGAVTPESGIVAGVNGYAYLAGGKLYPTLSAQCDVGFLVPLMRNTSFWLRSAMGQNFGNPDSVFGNEYFGGFGNNWLDYREANRYRSVSTLPGADIDQIKAHSYAKLTAELSLRPLRFNNFGFINLYPTYSQLNIFSSALCTDPWKLGYTQSIPGLKLYYNVGVQLNTEVVLLKFLKTTWSIGYARVFFPDGTSRGDWLLSLKLL